MQYTYFDKAIDDLYDGIIFWLKMPFVFLFFVALTIVLVVTRLTEKLQKEI